MAVAHIHHHLVGLGEVHGRISRHIQPTVLERASEGLGIGNDLRLIFALEVIHLVGGHEQPEQGAKVVIGD